MHHLRRLSLLAIFSLLLIGCGGSKHIKAKGKVMKAGQPFHTGEGEGLRMIFDPMAEPKGGQYFSYAAAYDPKTGTFEVMGQDGTGLPPGRYRVGLQLMKSKEDLLSGKLLGKNSPFICKVTSANEELVIDLDKSDFDTLVSKYKPPTPKERRPTVTSRPPPKGK